MATTPRQPSLKEGGYGQEQSSHGDINNLSRFFATKKLRYSLTSPPLLKDTPEGEMVLDKTLNRIYLQVNGSLKFIALKHE